MRIREIRGTQSAALVTLAVVALGLAAAPAQAGWKMKRAVTTAFIVWGAPLAEKCPDGIAVDIRDSREAFSAADLEQDDPAEWVIPGQCRVQIGKSEWTMMRGYDPLCSLILHGAGHIIGQPHTPHGVMSAGTSWSRSGASGGRWKWYGTDRRCRDRGRPYLSRHHAAL